MGLIGLFNDQNVTNNRDFSITIMTAGQINSSVVKIRPCGGWFETKKGQKAANFDFANWVSPFFCD